jgi:hypothetical protein
MNAVAFRKAALSFVGISALLALEAIAVGAQGDRFPSTTVKPSDYRLFRGVSVPFSVEYPKKDWQVIPGFGPAKVLFASVRGDAAIAVDDITLNVPLGADEIGDTFIKYETDDLKRTWPTARDVQTSIVKANAGPIVVIDFKEDAALGPQQVRQYSLPRKEHLYRVTCVALPSSFARYLPTCEHMAATVAFVPPPS